MEVLITKMVNIRASAVKINAFLFHSFIYLLQVSNERNAITTVKGKTEALYSKLMPGCHLHCQGFKALFIWAVLSEKWRVAEALWSYVDHPLPAALTAGVLLWEATDKLVKDRIHEDKVIKLRIQEKAWGSKACQLLEVLCDKDYDVAETIVKCASHHWDNKSPLELAVQHKNQDFVSKVVVQNLLSKAWMGNLRTNISSFRVS
jgi:hypothetical protein